MRQQPAFSFLWFLLIILPYPLNGLDQILRSRWNFDEGGASLYRLRGGELRAELLVETDDRFENLQVARFLFESPLFLAGTIKPEGLFRFFEMDSLLSYDALKQRSGYSPDSSAENLKSPGMALILFDRAGCIFENPTDRSLNGGIWLNTEPLAYGTIDFAVDYHLPGEVETVCTEWFRSSAPTPAGELWHGGSDFTYEGAFWSARMLSVCSGGTHFLIGTSFMPELTLYLNRFVIRTRYWRNSESYRSVSAEPSEWNWQGEGGIQYYGDNSYWESFYRGGQPYGVQGLSKGISHQCSVCWKRAGLRMDWKGAGGLEFDPFGEDLYSLNPEASCTLRFFPWTLGLEAEALWEGSPLLQTSRDMVLTVKHQLPGYLTNRLKIAYGVDRETEEVKPSWETKIAWGQWSLKACGTYFYPLRGERADPPCSLSLMVEWAD